MAFPVNKETKFVVRHQVHTGDHGQLRDEGAVASPGLNMYSTHSKAMAAIFVYFKFGVVAERRLRDINGFYVKRGINNNDITGAEFVTLAELPIDQPVKFFVTWSEEVFEVPTRPETEKRQVNEDADIALGLAEFLWLRELVPADDFCEFAATVSCNPNLPTLHQEEKNFDWRHSGKRCPHIFWDSRTGDPDRNPYLYDSGEISTDEWDSVKDPFFVVSCSNPSCEMPPIKVCTQKVATWREFLELHLPKIEVYLQSAENLLDEYRDTQRNKAKRSEAKKEDEKEEEKDKEDEKEEEEEEDGNEKEKDDGK